MKLLAVHLDKMIVILAWIIGMPLCAGAQELTPLNRIKQAYPNFIKEINEHALLWVDGERISFLSRTNEPPSLFEQINQPTYPSNNVIQCANYIPKEDPGRIRNEYFFGKMYGRDENAVKNNLTTIYWMPMYFGYQYPLQITKINGVDSKLKKISDQLELLVQKHPTYIKYLEAPSGTFYWRNIQSSDRRSPHSFGIAIDINSQYANYWIWDTGITENKLNQADKFDYKNHLPCEIVSVFEDNGFIWGGKWMHYDTMHFEYRPELVVG